jgi:hypothetical protein
MSYELLLQPRRFNNLAQFMLLKMTVLSLLTGSWVCYVLAWTSEGNDDTPSASPLCCTNCHMPMSPYPVSVTDAVTCLSMTHFDVFLPTICFDLSAAGESSTCAARTAKKKSKRHVRQVTQRTVTEFELPTDRRSRLNNWVASPCNALEVKWLL